TKMRSGTPTCGAARPMPGAAYMVSIMSLISRSISMVRSPTGCAGWWSTSSPYLRIGRIIPGRRCQPQRTRSAQRNTSLWKAKDQAPDAGSCQPFHVEVNQQPNFTSRQPQVGEHLRDVDRVEAVDRFDLDD